MSAPLTLFLALVLAFAAAHKALDRQRVGQAAARLAGMPAQFAPLLLVLAGSIEALCAVAMLIAPLRSGALVAAAVLWSGYALALLRRRGEVLDCGCDLVARPRAVTPLSAVRPGLLAVLALAAALAPPSPWTLDAPFAALALLALWLAASEISALPAAARASLRRTAP